MISIIICSINPVQFNRISAHYRQLMGAEPFEIIGVHDAKSLCEGYNRGMAHSKGDILIFSHDDIEIWTPEFTTRLKKHLGKFDGIGVVGATKVVDGHWSAAGQPWVFGQVCHLVNGNFFVGIWGTMKRVQDGIQTMDGLFLAFRRECITKVGWDEVTFNGFHVYDVDTTYRAALMGYKLGVAMDLPMLHMSHGDYKGSWKDFQQAFNRKHAATLAKTTERVLNVGSVLVRTKEEALEVMTAQYEMLPE